MGREVKRVPLDFQWPQGELWKGYILDSIPCFLCNGSGKAPTKCERKVWGDKTYESDYCRLCDGEGKVRPRIEIPECIGWQMWETCSEGSPISPVFRTPEELARWLADTRASSFGSMTATYEQWLGMIQRGSSPSAVISGGRMQSGVEFMANAPDQKGD